MPPRYELRGEDLLPDDAADALVAFWKQARYPLSRVAYPGRSIDRAGSRARLVLVSIMEGSLERAHDELDAFVRLHPDSRGPLGGRTAPYADSLRAMLAAAEGWPEPAPT